jgi:hypothetical protein
MPQLIGRWRGAVVDGGGRSADALLVTHRRQVIMRLNEGERRMAAGYAPDLTSVLPVMHRWQSGARLREVAADWPFLGSVAMAEARER